MDKPSTSRGGTQPNQRQIKPQRTRVGQRQDSQDDYEDMALNEQACFIARATADSRVFIDAYQQLVKIYPDSRDNFEVKLTKLLEIYLNAVITDTSVDDPDTAMVLDFARASMVLQGSTRIYAKKVDLLCQLTLKILGFVACGIAQQEGEEVTEGTAGPAHGQRRAHKDPNFYLVDMKAHKSSLKVKPDHRGDKKLNFRPKCFPALIRQDQSVIDKKRITTLNPSFTGDKTTFRLWGPISGENGHLVVDLGNAKNKFSINEDLQDDEDNWNDDVAMDLDDIPLSVEEPVAETPTETVVETVTCEAAPTREEIIDAEEEDKENTDIGAVNGASDAWQEMPLESGVKSKNIDPKIKISVPKSKAKQDLQEDFLSKLMTKVKKKKTCFGDEALQEGMELQLNNKMLPEIAKSKKKRDVPSLAPSKTGVEGLDYFDEHESDAEDVAGFDHNGKVVYVTKEVDPNNQEDDMNESAAPDVDISEWGAPDPDNEDVLGSLNGPRHSMAAADTDAMGNDFPADLPDDTELAARLETWYKMIHKEQKIIAAKPQFTFNTYCQEVLQRFPENKDRLLFKEIAEGLPAGQIARYLLATLQLANTNNVEIQGLVAGQVSNETMEVVLLNKTRVLPSFDDD